MLGDKAWLKFIPRVLFVVEVGLKLHHGSEFLPQNTEKKQFFT